MCQNKFCLFNAFDYFSFLHDFNIVERKIINSIKQNEAD